MYDFFPFKTVDRQLKLAKNLQSSRSPVFLPGESQGWSRTELDMTEVTSAAAADFQKYMYMHASMLISFDTSNIESLRRL